MFIIPVVVLFVSDGIFWILAFDEVVNSQKLFCVFQVNVDKLFVVKNRFITEHLIEEDNAL